MKMDSSSQREDHIYWFIFFMRVMSCCWCHVCSGCKCRQWAEVRGGQQLFASPDSKTDNLVKTSKCVCWEGATRRIVKRSYGSGWSTLCVFRHHLLKTLLFFHCSSRDVPHLRQTVRDEYSIALPSECVQ